MSVTPILGNDDEVLGADALVFALILVVCLVCSHAVASTNITMLPESSVAVRT